MIKTSWEGNCFLNFFNNKASLGNVDKTIFKSKSTSPYKLLKFTHDYGHLFPGKIFSWYLRDINIKIFKHIFNYVITFC